MPKWKPLKGMTFGKLTVLDDYKDESKPKGRQYYCKCQCSCDDRTIISVKAMDLTRDRIDNDGNYCKENCRWLTNKEQQANKGCTQGIEENGKLLSIKAYCDKYGLPYNRIRYSANKNNISYIEELYSGGWNIDE